MIRDEPLDGLVIAALARRSGTASAVSAALHPSLRDVISRRALTPRVQARLEALHEAGWVDGTALTAEGHCAAERRFGTGTVLTSRHWRSQLVVPALGVADTPEPRRRALAWADPLRAEILRQRFGLELPPLPSLDDVVQALGYGRPGLTSRRAVRALVAPALGVSSSWAGALGRALVSQWAQGSGLFARPSSRAFPDLVLRAARSSPTGRFGDTLVLISHAWRQFAEVDEALPLDRFKQALVAAHQQQALSLKGAEMPQLHDPSDLAESEVRYRGSRFHFIRI